MNVEPLEWKKRDPYDRAAEVRGGRARRCDGAPGETSIRCSLRIRPVHRFRPNATRVKVSAEMKPVTVAAISGAAIPAAATIAPAAESIQSVVGSPILVRFRRDPWSAARRSAVVVAVAQSVVGVDAVSSAQDALSFFSDHSDARGVRTDHSFGVCYLHVA